MDHGAKHQLDHAPDRPRRRSTTAFAAALGLAASVLPVTLAGPRASAAGPTVTSCDEVGLRAALAAAAPGDTVTFGCSGTIVLTSAGGGTLRLDRDVTIDGSGQAVTISGGNAVGVVEVATGVAVTIRDLTIADGSNGDTAVGTATAGGVANQGTLSLVDVVVAGNAAAGGTGGIWSLGTLDLLRTTVEGNTGLVAGVNMVGGTAHIVDSIVRANHGDTGGLYVNVGSVTVSGSTFDGNGGGTAGGVRVSGLGASLSMANSTIRGNWASSNVGSVGGSAGAILLEPLSIVALDSLTIAGNHAQLCSDNTCFSSGGIYSTLSTLTMRNTVLDANLGRAGNCELIPGTDAGGNLSSDASCGFGDPSSANDVVDLNLDVLSENGGPTPTMALLAGSAAIGAATCTQSVDQRGLPRPDVAGTTCDSGAFEVQPVDTGTGTGTGSGTGTDPVPDNCPGVDNPDQADADGDGIGDACEGDTAPPVVTASLDPAPNAGGWHDSPPVISWEFTDPEPSAGVLEPAPPSITAGLEGTHDYGSAPVCDVLGNCAAGQVTVMLDTTAPSVSVTGVTDGGTYVDSAAPLPGCVASDAGSGLDGSCAVVVTEVGQSPGATTYSVEATVSDVAGNTATATVMYTLTSDTSAPTIAASPDRAPNADGWYRTPVTWTFVCVDDTGVAQCPAPLTLSADGAAMSFSVSATDIAGNIGTTTVAGINIDRTAPTITVSPDVTVGISSTVTVDCAAIDALSGIAVADCTPMEVPATDLGPGVHTFHFSATDVAGNTAQADVTVEVTVAAADLSALVRRYLAGGGPGNDGIVNALEVKIGQQEFGAFVNQVDALCCTPEKRKRLTVEQHGALIMVAALVGAS